MRAAFESVTPGAPSGWRTMRLARSCLLRSFTARDASRAHAITVAARRGGEEKRYTETTHTGTIRA
eukprot:CAMPEP_0180327052 /NCGR_PEP_ID=MMETSP0988-20121125/39336_1 /TAXON_ID=697907 /ORGANISM="non described non described, Strain CCMP2293" /LENGTH=65 /DNA_ID=CAMNT_0022313691 /DNA_START=254 /DNA_END=451 /DNA_ORIENTATION=-